MIRTEIDSMPTELDEISRRVMQLEIERQALKKEDDAASKTRGLSGLEKELAAQKEQADKLKAQWELEKVALTREKEIEAADRGRAAAHRRGQTRSTTWKQAAKLEYGELPGLLAAAARGGAARNAQNAERTAERGGDRGGDRRDRVALDGHPGFQAGREGERISCWGSRTYCTSA